MRTSLPPFGPLTGRGQHALCFAGMRGSDRGGVGDQRPETRFPAVVGAETRAEDLVRLEPAVVVDERRQRPTLRQMTDGMPVALRLGAVERVLDHGAAKQSCRVTDRYLPEHRGTLSHRTIHRRA